MKKILILGAGLVVRPIVKYLLNKNYIVTVGDREKHKADALVNGYANGNSTYFDVNDKDLLDKLVSEHDITVSLLPFMFHVLVAESCIKFKKNMVTTSYVKPEMKALDAEAKAAGIIILNELGLDPGIDHMSAMRIIDHIHGKGGEVEEFYSFCGALVAPEVEKNPFNYKFTWAPKGVVMASNNDGKYLLKGNIINIPTVDLFKNPLTIDFPKVGKLEVYPNRDSLPYAELYGIPETKTIFRGTFRYPLWCEVIDNIKKTGLLSYEKINLAGKTYADFMAYIIKSNESTDIKNKFAKHFNFKLDSAIINALEWLGLFENKKINRDEDSPFEIVSDLMIEKMLIKNHERDMVVLQHTFVGKYKDGSKEVIKSRMLDFGTPATDTSIARTVALPAAVGVEMILKGEIKSKGVYIPVIPEIYNPILDTLEKLDIVMVEEYGLPISENIQ